MALFQHFTFPEILAHQIARTRGDLSSKNLLAQLASQFGRARGTHGALRVAIGKYDPTRKKWVRHVADPTELRRTPEVHARGADLLAVGNAESGVGAAVKHLLERGRLPSPNHVRMRPDRSLEIDFAAMEDLKALREENAALFRRQYQNAEVPAPDELDDEFNEVDSLVNCIRDRGGQVVFLRMPSSGERLKIEEQYHPKAKYWNRFAATSSAICVHWTELEGAGNLTCPDDSHLDYRDAIRFTDALVAELRERGVFRAR